MRETEVLFTTKLPDWLVACLRIALLGEIYPAIRAIAIGYHDSGLILIQYYLDREPTDFDLRKYRSCCYKSSCTGRKRTAYQKIDIQYLLGTGAKRDLELLSRFMYSKR